MIWVCSFNVNTSCIKFYCINIKYNKYLKSDKFLENWFELEISIVVSLVKLIMLCKCYEFLLDKQSNDSDQLMFAIMLCNNSNEKECY